MSTPVLMFKYLLNGAVIQLATVCLQKLLTSEGGAVSVSGVGGIWFSMLFKYCYFNHAHNIKFCCFNWKFKRGLYPFVLLGVCCLLLFRIPLDMVVGLLYGLMQVMAEKVTVYPANCLDRLTSKLSFNIGCWISQGQGNNLDFSDRSAYSNM